MKAPAFNYGLLRVLRDDHGWSRDEMLVKLHGAGLPISLDTIGNWERGESPPDAKNLPILAQVLECSVEDFYRPTPKQATKA